MYSSLPMATLIQGVQHFICFIRLGMANLSVPIFLDLPGDLILSFPFYFVRRSYIEASRKDRAPIYAH